MAVEMSVDRSRINHLCPLRCRTAALEASPTFLSSDCTGQWHHFWVRGFRPQPSVLAAPFGAGGVLSLGGVLASCRLHALLPVRQSSGSSALRGGMQASSTYSFRGLVRGGKWVAPAALNITLPYTGEDSHGSGFDPRRIWNIVID